MLNTVQRPTASACGKSLRTSTMFDHFACRVTRYHASKDASASGRFLNELPNCPPADHVQALCSQFENQLSRKPSERSLEGVKRGLFKLVSELYLFTYHVTEHGLRR